MVLAVDSSRSPQYIAFPGQAVIPSGEILLEDDGTRPAWAKDGSFLVFRQLKQLVPEFNKLLTDNPIRAPGLTPEEGSELLGARMVGRWKGAHRFSFPRTPTIQLSAGMRNNNFDYTVRRRHWIKLNVRLRRTFRKTWPRADLPSEQTHRHIIRGGIPYGPEVSYQSNIAAQFEFIQKSWASSPNFRHPGEGFDPILGANEGAPRNVTGLDPTNLNRTITLMTDFLVSCGGKYFFSPSLSAIADTLSF